MIPTYKFNEILKLEANSLGLDYVAGGDGPSHAQVAFIGEGLGVSEVQKKMPFVGGAGMKLWGMANKYSLNRGNTYATNVVKRQISLSSHTDEKIVVNKGELQHWTELLHKELANLPNLTTIVVLGNMALHAITGHSGITLWRGSVLDYVLRSGRKVKVVCMVNPAMVIREPKLEVMMMLDFTKLNMVLKGEFVPHVVVPTINPTIDEAVAAIRSFRTSVRPVSFDIETPGGELGCVGLADNAHTGICIPFRGTGNAQLWTVEQEVRLHRELAALFDDRSVRFIAQNGMYDSSVLWYKNRIRVHGVWLDTMLAHHTLFPLLPHSLAFLTSQYTTHPYYKDDGKDWRDSEAGIDQLWEYNVKDACITWAAAMKMEKELKSEKLHDFFFGHVMKAQPKLVKATVTGIKADEPLKDKIKDQLSLDVQRLVEEFYNAVHTATNDKDYYPNPASPKQLQDLLFHRLRLVGRGTSTDKANRARMLEHPATSENAKAVLKAIDKLAKEQKFYSTYAQSRLDEDGRFRCEYKQTGVVQAPGRLSSSSTGWGTGLNLQNQPERAKQMFIADEGNVFVYFDLSQAEARVVGWLANIESWIEQFEQARIDGKFDTHRALAAEMWGLNYDDVPMKDHDEHGNHTIRYIAKRCRHGLNYRMLAQRLAEVTGLSQVEANTAFNKYHAINPELAVWWRTTINEFMTKRELWTPMGRRFKVVQPITEDVLDSVVAFRPQSTVGDKVTRVWYRSEDDGDWPRGWRVALNIHDALIGTGPVYEYRNGSRFTRSDHQALRVLIKHAEEPIIINERKLIIPAEPGISVADEQGVHRWSTIKKVDKQEVLQ